VGQAPDLCSELQDHDHERAEQLQNDAPTDMVYEHEDVDPVQHRLVRWREIGAYSANIWVSCFTRPTLEGIRLATWTGLQQSILERCTGIIYKNGAQFASKTDRSSTTVDAQGRGPSLAIGSFLSAGLFQAPPPKSDEREAQLQSREQALRNREKVHNQRERALESVAAAQAKKNQEIEKAQGTYKQLLNFQDKQLLNSQFREIALEEALAQLNRGRAQGEVEPSEGNVGRRRDQADKFLALMTVQVVSSSSDEAEEVLSAKVSGKSGRVPEVEEQEEQVAEEEEEEEEEEETEETLAEEAGEFEEEQVVEENVATSEQDDGGEGDEDSQLDEVDTTSISKIKTRRKKPADPDDADDFDVERQREHEVVHAGKALHVKNVETFRIPVKEMGD